MNTKKCNQCKEIKPLTEYYKQLTCKFGVTPVCKSCTKKKHKQWKLENKERSKLYFRERKRFFKQRIVDTLGGKCFDCGLVDLPVVYDVHHLNPQLKDQGLAELCSYSWDRIQKELDSGCILLCSNCHRKRHYKVGEDWGNTKEIK